MYLRPATENLQNKEYEESRTDRIPNTKKNSDGNGDSDETEDDSMNITNMIRYFSEVATLIGVLSYVIFQQGDEIKNQGLTAFLKQLVSNLRFLRKLKLKIIIKFSIRLTHRQRRSF